MSVCKVSAHRNETRQSVHTALRETFANYLEQQEVSDPEMRTVSFDLQQLELTHRT